MCGIFVKSSHQPLSRDLCWQALKAMAHRGPDGQDCYLSRDRRRMLGHCRLAVVGIDNGNQPLRNEDGTIHAVVNGEFYGYRDIRKQLQAKGHRFSTQSDSEILIHLYEEYGVDCLNHLRGEFAFVILDETRDRIFAARDPFGIKPLFYTSDRNGFSAASEVKALFASGTPAAWNPAAYFHASSFQYTLPGETLFANIHELRPGHFLIVEGTQLNETCWWDLDYAVEETEDDWIARFRHDFDEAVALRLQADVPVCCHLSGGLDSSAVLAVATQQLGSAPDCFTIGFDHDHFDEGDLASQTAAHFGATQHRIHLSRGELLQHMEEAVYFSEGLSVNGHLPAKFLLNRAIQAAGYKVALTGEGADEVLAGYPHLRVDLLRADGNTERIASLMAGNSASKGIMLAEGSGLDTSATRQLLGFVPAFLEAKAAFGLKMREVLRDDFIQDFAQKDAQGEFLACFDHARQLKDRHHVLQSLYLWSKSALPKYILNTLGDGCEMSASIEGRLPFLDQKVFATLSQAPLGMKIHNLVEKHLLREAYKAQLPRVVQQRRKHPFVAPPLSADKLCEELIQDHLHSADFAQVPFIDQSKTLKLCQRLPDLDASTRQAYDPVLITALSTLFLHKGLNLEV